MAVVDIRTKLAGLIDNSYWEKLGLHLGMVRRVRNRLILVTRAEPDTNARAGGLEETAQPVAVLLAELVARRVRPCIAIRKVREMLGDERQITRACGCPES